MAAAQFLNQCFVRLPSKNTIRRFLVDTETTTGFAETNILKAGHVTGDGPVVLLVDEVKLVEGIYVNRDGRVLGFAENFGVEEDETPAEMGLVFMIQSLKSYGSCPVGWFPTQAL